MGVERFYDIRYGFPQRHLKEDLTFLNLTSHDPANADTAYGLFADLLTAVCGDGSGLGRLRPPSAI